MTHFGGHNHSFAFNYYYVFSMDTSIYGACPQNNEIYTNEVINWLMRLQLGLWMQSNNISIRLIIIPFSYLIPQTEWPDQQWLISCLYFVLTFGFTDTLFLYWYFQLKLVKTTFMIYLLVWSKLLFRHWILMFHIILFFILSTRGQILSLL